MVWKDDFGIHVKGICRGIREMIAYVAHIGGTKQGVANGMYQYISIAMAKQAQRVVYLYSAKP